MSIAVQQQQSQQATIAVSGRSASSCTPLVPGYPWHMHRSDFEAIGAYDAYADALRGFETMTNNRIAELRHFEGIPMDTLPGDDDLWLEVSVRDLAKWTVHAWGKTKYAEILDDPQLFELGFLCYRFVAYPGCYLLEPVETTIYQDLQGNPFIIVDDDAGNYIDEMGEQCNAKDQGYSLVRRQFLYCIENVNAALAKLTGQSPPAPMPRWHSLQKKGAQETTKSTLRTTHSFQTSAAQGCLDDEIKGIKAGSKLCVNKHNTVDGNLSSDLPEKLMSTNNLSSNSLLRSAPWSPETCVALSAQINRKLFAIPEHIDEATYNRDWLEPAQRLIEKRCTDFAEPSRAWERVELHIWAMLIGQTWYAQGRTKKTPFTLRNVESNWDTVEAELRKGSWPNYAHIEYFGPSLFDEQPAQSSYAQGYSAQVVESTAQALPDDEQPEQIIEVTAQVEECADDQVSTVSSEQSVSGEEAAQTEQSIKVTQGYSLRKARILAAQIREEHPEVGVRLGRSGVDLYLVGIEIALNAWVRIARPIDYYAITQEIADAIDQAEHYARQRNAAQSNDGHADSQGPPGYGEVSEGGDE